MVSLKNGKKIAFSAKWYLFSDPVTMYPLIIELVDSIGRDDPEYAIHVMHYKFQNISVQVGNVISQLQTQNQTNHQKLGIP